MNTVRNVLAGCTILATAPSGICATLGELIDKYPQPVCANVIPLSYLPYPSGASPAMSRLSFIQGYVGLRRYPSSNPYVQNLTVPRGAAVELRPQLEPGGNGTDGEWLQIYFNGKLSSVLMKRSTFKYFASARVASTTGTSPYNTSYLFLSDFQIRAIDFAEYSTEGTALRNRVASPMEVRSNVVGPGSVQLGILAAPLPAAVNNISVDFYTVGTWYHEVNGKQYCGKGLRYFDYSMRVDAR